MLASSPKIHGDLPAASRAVLSRSWSPRSPPASCGDRCQSTGQAGTAHDFCLLGAPCAARSNGTLRARAPTIRSLTAAVVTLIGTQPGRVLPGRTGAGALTGYVRTRMLTAIGYP